MVFLSLAGLIAFFVGLVAIIKGRVKKFRIPNRRIGLLVLVFGLILIGLSGQGIEEQGEERKLLEVVDQRIEDESSTNKSEQEMESEVGKEDKNEIGTEKEIEPTSETEIGEEKELKQPSEIVLEEEEELDVNLDKENDFLEKLEKEAGDDPDIKQEDTFLDKVASLFSREPAQEEMPPKVPEKAKEEAMDELKEGWAVVRDTHIGVDKNENRITLAVHVIHGTTFDAAKEIGDSFIRLLGSFSSIYSNEIERGPTRDFFGSLYDYYTVQVVVGTGPEKEDVIAFGVISRSAHRLVW